VLTLLAGSADTSLLAQPGTIAFVIVFGMGVLCYFLFRSMSRHLRKVNMMARDEADREAAEDEVAHATGGGVGGPSSKP
jgi:hypothetical protein